MSDQERQINIDFSGGRPDWLNLATGNDSSVKIVRPLSEQEADLYPKATEAITSFVHSHWPIRVAEGNILQFQEFLDSMHARFSGGQIRFYTDEFHVQANRHIMNFLASAGSFLAFSKRQHKRLFGRKSVQLEELESFIKSSEADSFELRLAMQLRNFAAHHNLPLGGLHLTARLGENEQKVHAVEVTFKTARLLEDRGLDDRLRVELLKAPPEIRAMPILVGAMHRLDDIHEVITRHLLPALVPHAELIVKLGKEVTSGIPQIVNAIVTKTDRPIQIQWSIGPILTAPAEEILRIAKGGVAN